LKRHGKESWRTGEMALLLVLLITIGCSAPVAFCGADQSQASSGKKVSLSLKLSAGAGYLLNGMGDLNTYRLGREAWAGRLDQEPGYSSALDWGRPSFVPDLSADIIVHIGSRFGFGFGTGFIQGQSNGVHSVTYSGQGNNWWSGEPYEETGRTADNYTFELTAVPIKFDLYFFQPLKSSGTLLLFAYAGVGYYFGKVKKSTDRHDESETDYSSYIYADESDSHLGEEAKDETFGFHGGLGLEFKISRAISLCSEVFARYVDFNDWRGDLDYSYRSSSKVGDGTTWWDEQSSEETVSWKGSMWTYKIYDGYYNFTDTNMFILPEKPQDSDFQEVRKTALNLNAFGIVFSVKFQFDLF
jgi:hypothetical protein